jgi:D-glycero-alpha-D-manno-heptose-7-phosphate kinase
LIITRTPLRISLGGGGTDLPSYYETSGSGFLVAAAINRHIYVTIHENFEPKDYFLQYSRIENVQDVKDIQHPLFREALLYTSTPPGIQISSEADIPAGTGLGSSGTFAVGLLKALRAYSHQYYSNEDIARDACHLEIDRLGEPVGKQDQYIAAVGGLSTFEFRADGSVQVESLQMERDARNEFEENLMLFFTGFRRSASEELSALDKGASVSDSEIRKNLDAVKEAGYLAAETLREGKLVDFAKMLTAQWELKFSRSPSKLHEQIDDWIRQGVAAGALGGKLVGAGGGGFLLFYAENKSGLRARMAELGLREVPVSFDNVGSVVLT